MRHGNYVAEPKMHGVVFHVADLRHWHAIEIRCGGCRKQVMIDAEAAVRRCGKDRSSTDIEAKAKCQRCGKVGDHTVRLYKVSRN